ncbi:MAG TPA: cupin domain-containing protein [Thermoanaerobaculia bacterium]|jgi:anti-sigma factor ChrR (cupin superfamily)|nr:cupin domain-containing protein [Thermoanaerobaculia bacterium]
MTETLTREDLMLLDGIVAESIEPIDPPAGLRDRILGAAFATPQNTRTVRASEGRWHRVVPGVTVKTLSIDVERDTATILMMFEPGASVPAHDHGGAEDSFVVSGSCRIGESYLLKGDFHHADAGTRHEEVVSDEGCVLLLVVDRQDYLAA